MLTEIFQEVKALEKGHFFLQKLLLHPVLRLPEVFLAQNGKVSIPVASYLQLCFPLAICDECKLSKRHIGSVLNHLLEHRDIVVLSFCDEGLKVVDQGVCVLLDGDNFLVLVDKDHLFHSGRLRVKEQRLGFVVEVLLQLSLPFVQVFPLSAIAGSIVVVVGWSGHSHADVL